VVARRYTTNALRKQVGLGTLKLGLVGPTGGSARRTGAFAHLRGRGFTIAWRDAPRIANWSGDDLLFSARVGDSANLWKIHIAGFDSHLTGNPQRLTSGIGLDVYPSLTTDGHLVFASLTNSVNVWTLPADTNRGKVTGQLKRATESIGPNQFASLSADGKLLAYSSVRYNRPHLWIKNLETGREWPVTNSSASEVRPQLSSDGSILAYYSGDQNGNGSVVAVPVRGGVPDQLCRDCVSPYDISPDNNVVLYRKGAVLRAFDLRSRRDRLFLNSKDYRLYQSRFSPDGSWVTFGAAGYAAPDSLSPHFATL
jgi:WD40-like Beta Propeller Repeat